MQHHSVSLTMSKTATYNARSDLAGAFDIRILYTGTKGLSWSGPIAQNSPTVGLLSGCRTT